MTHKEQLLHGMERELLLLKRLATHIEERDLDYRPSPHTRTTLELMKYLCSHGSVMLRWYIHNDLDKAAWDAIKAEGETVNIANYPTFIDTQIADIKRYIAEISDEDLLTRMVTMPWKEELPLGLAIINGPIKWLATYRMQLFNNLKMNGHTTLGTGDAWVLNKPATGN